MKYLVITVQTTTHSVEAESEEQAIQAVCEGDGLVVDDTEIDMQAIQQGE
jgi:hypothetical protein